MRSLLIIQRNFLSLRKRVLVRILQLKCTETTGRNATRIPHYLAKIKGAAAVARQFS